MKAKFVLPGLIIAASTFSLNAQVATPRATIRQGHQHTRIAQGRANGELTRKETCELRHQQRRVNRHKRVARADGFVTPRERAGIQMHQNKANRDIWRKKHNKKG